MAELTPNEKAASFIGWKPSDWCKSGVEFCSIHGPSGTHGNAVPDMSRPANYMRALEALPVAQFKGLWAIAATRTGYRCFIDLYGEVTGWGDEYNCYLDADGRTVAEAVIGALVQLYDGENKNG